MAPSSSRATSSTLRTTGTALCWRPQPRPEQKAASERQDRSVIHYNDRITLGGILQEAYRYLLGSRSAVEWIIDRYWVKTDKASGIVNDPNDWSRQVEDPRYIVDLLAGW